MSFAICGSCKPYLNIRDFGAVGDGAADDTAALQKALSAARPGGAVFVPAGRYRIGKVKIPGGVSVLGNASWGYSAWGYENNKIKEGAVTDPMINGHTVFLPLSGEADALFDLEGTFGVRIAGLSFDGLMLGENFHGIKAVNASGVAFEDVRICHFTGCGLALGGAKGFAVRRSLIIKNRRHAVEVTGAKKGTIIDTQLSYNDGAGLWGEGETEDLLITANRIEGGRPGGVWLTGARGVSVSGNSFDTTRGPAVALFDCAGAALTGNMARLSGHDQEGELDSHILLKNCRGVSVIGNSFWGWPELRSNPWVSRYGVAAEDLTDCVIAQNSFFNSCRESLVRTEGANRNVLVQENMGALYSQPCEKV